MRWPNTEDDARILIRFGRALRKFAVATIVCCAQRRDERSRLTTPVVET